MRKYAIEVSYEITGLIEVKAENQADAIRQISAINDFDTLLLEVGDDFEDERLMIEDIEQIN
nr:MAG TPA: hypothetical protein [Caudoviricetes sp.]